MRKTFTYILTLSFLLCNVFFLQAGSKYTYTVEGKVKDTNKNAIANVVVSDGYNTTATNEFGEYSIAANDSAKFIFISIPSGYEIPHKGNIPNFYKDIKGLANDTVFNFKLEKKTTEDDYIVLTVMADPQVQIQADLDRFTNEAFKDLNELKASYPSDASFIGMTAGDNMWDAPRLYPGYKKAYEQLNYPFFQIIGNHDHDEKTVGNDYESSHYFEKYFGPAYYSFNKGACHFIALDNILYDTRPKYEEKITAEQLNWLKQDLSHVKKTQLVIISMHSPVYRRGMTPILKEPKKLLSVLKGYNVIFVSGHTHRMNHNRISKKISEYTFSPMMGNSWAGFINNNGCPNGYGVLEIKGNKLVNKYFKSLAQERDYQMNLYPVGTVKSQLGSVVAHIWDYNSKWKIKVYENGKYSGTMEQFTDYDPIAYAFFSPNDKPERKPKLKPAKTYNLFHYTPRFKQSVVKIVVTDEFGNSYSEEIQNVL